MVLSYLFVGKYEERDSGQLVLVQQLLQLDTGLFHAPPVRRVDHVDHRIRGVEVVPPVRPDRFLPTHIPYVEFEGVVRQGFYVESLGGSDVSHVLLAEVLQDRGLPRIIQTQDEYAYLRLGLFKFPEIIQ